MFVPNVLYLFFIDGVIPTAGLSGVYVLTIGGFQAKSYSEATNQTDTKSVFDAWYSEDARCLYPRKQTRGCSFKRIGGEKIRPI